jgi:hypothetical protein
MISRASKIAPGCGTIFGDPCSSLRSTRMHRTPDARAAALDMRPGKNLAARVRS